MGRGRGRSLCALWGGISLGTGTLAYALFSSSTAGCSTNVVVLTRSAVTARGCAAYSVLARIGVGLIVLGAVLLLGSFVLAFRNRRAPGKSRVGEAVGAATATSNAAPVVAVPADTRVAEPAATGAATEDVAAAAPVAPVAPVTPATAPRTPGHSAIPGADRSEPVGPLGSAIDLPPGWYGNPNSPGRPVQWWDGSKLVDRPARPEE